MNQDALNARIETSLGEFTQLMATDGYTVSLVGFDDGRLTLDIQACEGACPDCLVPPQIMRELVRSNLPADIAVADIDIRYPGASAG